MAASMVHSGASNLPLPFSKRPRSTESDAQDRRAPQHLPPNNLPNPLTSFVGRQAEVAAVSSLILDENVRLLTLTGPGGVGKTRLAFAVAEELLPDFEDGVYFVALAPLSDPQLVVPTIAQTLGIKEEGATPLIQRLQEHLRAKGLLLLLDNFEQVAAAAPQVTALLSQAPGVQVIVTSRVSLHLYGEHEYSVPPMLLPDDTDSNQHTAEQLAEYEAIQLFIERAQLVHPDFSFTSGNARPIAQICARLDGLPLALELAAARTRLLSPQALLSRLDKSLPLLTGGPRDLPDRQKTLRGAIDWSYALLDATEQQLFARLSVFAGGCTLDAVAFVTRDLDIEESELVNRLESLVDKNLLRLREEPDGEPRFWMLATIREYALEKLAESDEMGTVRQAHQECFFAFAEKAFPELRGSNQAAWFAHLDIEHDNLRAALDWSLRPSQIMPLQFSRPMLWVLQLFWRARGYIGEGRRWFNRLLAGVDVTQPETVQNWQLNVFTYIGILAGIQGDYDEAIASTKKTIEIGRILGDQDRMMHAMGNLGILARLQGNYLLAEEIQTENVTFWRTASDKTVLAGVLVNLGIVLRNRGRYKEAEALLAESIPLRHEVGDESGLTLSLGSLAEVAREQGDAVRARSLLDEAMEFAQRAGDKTLLATNQVSLGILMCDLGLYEAAEALLDQGLAMARTIGEQEQITRGLAGLGQVALHLKDYGRARSRFQEAITARLRVREYEAGMASILEWMAYLEVTQATGEDTTEGYRRAAMRRAATLLGATEARREEMGAPMPPISHARHAQTVQEAQGYLGPADFLAAWGEERSIAFEQACTLALQDLQEGLPAATDSAATQQSAIHDDEGVELTLREFEVLRLVAEGLTNKEIAERLVLSYRTVQNHLYNIFNKLDVTTRSAATRYAMERGIV